MQEYNNRTGSLLLNKMNLLIQLREFDFSLTYHPFSAIIMSKCHPVVESFNSGRDASPELYRQLWEIF